MHKKVLCGVMMAIITTSVHAIDDIQLAVRIADKHKVSMSQALTAVSAAEKYSDTFPSKLDILAVVGIESSHNPRAVSNLRKDPAVGLMQVRPKIWKREIKQSGKSLATIDGQIAVGSAILRDYYNKTGKNKKRTIMAYNVGIGAVAQGKQNPTYYSKFVQEYKTLVASTAR